MFVIRQLICRSFVFSGLIVLGILFVATQAQAADWSIENFDSVIEVNEDATLTVTEQIEVNFDVAKHGILRSIPVSYHDDFNNRVRANITIISVFQDEKPVLYDVNRVGSEKVIRIGDPNVTILGKHIYSISYQVDRALLYFDDFDEVYWNVTGSDSTVLIQRSTAVVSLPEGASVIQAKCFTGGYGSLDENCGMAEDGNVIGFAADDMMTVAVGFTKGVINQPTLAKRITWFLIDNWIALFPLLLMLAVFILWWKMGRDPKLHKTIIAEYEPPQGLWAPYLGLLLQSTVSRQALTAMIIHLAVAGYIGIEVKEGDKKKEITTLIKKKSDTGLDEPHKKLMKILFKSDKNETTLDSLKNRIQTSEISELRKSLYKKMQQDKLFTSSSFWLRPVVLALAVVQIYSSVMLGFFFGGFAGALLFIGGILSIVFGLLMPKRTLQGAELARKAAGFKLFMHTAERYRSQWQEREHIFFDYLPYAIIFRDTDHWAKVFANLDIKQPDWYQSTLPFNSSTIFASQISSFSKSFAAASTPHAPSSGGSGYSGSSGGGFSGGGFGGGGTSSW